MAAGRDRRSAARKRGLRAGVVAVLTLSAALWPSTPRAAAAQEPSLRKIAELDLLVLGLQAFATDPNPVVPKNIATGVPVRVTAGGAELGAADLVRFLGPGYHLEAELSGPGLSQTVTLPQLDPGEEPPADPLLLPIPPLPIAGDYSIANLRIVTEGRTVLDVTPRALTLEVIDQILVTSVKTRALTLDEIREKGIVLDSDDYLGFEFTLGLKLESEPINVSFPVVFDRQGVPVPQPLRPPPLPSRVGVPTVVPMLLEATVDEDNDPSTPPERIPLTTAAGEPIRIPSLLVIPGNVGFLKQFFSAQLFVANGAPVGSGLRVRDVTGTVKMPPGLDRVVGTADDPLALPELERNGEIILQPETLPVRGLGPDGLPGTADDVALLRPAEQGQAEFLIRGEREGFHQLAFDVAAVLEGLPVGPVNITGTAQGGVLVRNPFFDVTFAVPSVVRKDEPFSFFVTVTNIGQGVGNDIDVTLDAARMSGATLLSDGTQNIETLQPGEAATLEYEFRGDRTGQVVASYLDFEPGASGSGKLNFTLAVGERGVPLSPDTLVLPASVDSVPKSVVDAAMRVLGQAWSVANAPAGTLPSSVERIPHAVVRDKALALAEAGLRIDLGQPVAAAVRDVALDFYGGEPLDVGFDQLLRQTDAGRELAAALGSELAIPALDAGGAVAYEEELARLAASGPDLLSFAVASGATAAAVDVTLTDGLGRAVWPAGGATPVSSTLPGGAVLALGAPGSAPLLGLATAPEGSPYVLEMVATESGPIDVSVTFPRGDGRSQRGYVTGVELPAGGRGRVTADPAQPNALVLELDLDGDGVFESQQPLAVETLLPEGPRLVAAAVIGPETLDGAAPFGMQVAVLFDRVVDEGSAADASRYAVPDNEMLAAKRQLSGRLVFGALARPEGNYLPTTLSVTGLRDTRGASGPAGSVPLPSRLEDPGAVVTGRVFQADGSSVTSGRVTYLNNTRLLCNPPQRFGLAAADLDDGGRFELRYVRRDNCGLPWELVTVDPVTGARRAVTGFVRADGEHIVVDIALIGRGSVEGVVSDLSGAPVPGAAVAAVSLEDNQNGGTATTDGEGYYSIPGITVGPVSVRAVKGTALGQSTGRVPRAGTAGRVDLVLDGGSVSASGRVLKLEPGATEPVSVPGLQVLYRLTPSGGPDTVVGVAVSGPNGEFAFTGMPSGAFTISAALNTRDADARKGVGSPGDVLVDQNLLIVIPPDTAFGTVRGTVWLPGGKEPATDVLVTIASRSALSLDGSYEITGVPVRPGVSQGVFARTRDGRRTGTTSVLVSEAGEVVTADVFVSGLGTARFTVLGPGPNPQPLADQEVRLFTGCADPCGCVAAQTDASGTATFGNLPVGTVLARAYTFDGPAADVATGTATIKSDGGVASAILQFQGSGSVSGVVVDQDGDPVFGADVVMRSQVFFNNGSTTCQLVERESHRGRSDVDGNFTFQGVNVGRVRLTASQLLYPTPVGVTGTVETNGDDEEVTLRLVNTIAGELSGLVYLPDGKTLAGAGVEVKMEGALPEVVVKTDGNGLFRFAKIFPQGSYLLTALDPVTGGVAQTRIFMQAGEDAGHDLRLKGRGTVRVAVVDGSGDPVESAFVSLRETEFPGRDYDGAVGASNGGLLVFENVFEGPFSVSAEDVFARGGRVSGTLPGPGETVDVEVRLSSTGRVVGVFRLPDQTPIPNGTVKLTAGGRVIGQTTTQGTGDAIGSFAFDFVPAGAVRLEAEDPFTGRTGIAVGTIDEDGQELPLDVIARGLGTVQGAVWSNGQRQPLALVQIVSGGYNASTSTDADGHYLVEGVPEGRVVVTASLDSGLLAATASDTLPGDGLTITVDVFLRPSGRVQGRVVSAGEPPPPTPPSLVTIRTGGQGGATQQTTTDPAGVFVFDRVPSGAATVTVDVLSGIDNATASVQIAEGDNQLPDITLRGVGSVRGTTVDSMGDPVAGRLVLRGDGYSVSFQTGNDGVFFVPEILAGPVTATLAVTSGPFALYGAAAGEILPGAELSPFDVPLQETASVQGIVLRAGGGGPAHGADVTIRVGGVARSVQAGVDGSFLMPGIPLGTATASFEDPITTGVAKVDGIVLDTDGQVLDLGEVVLDDEPVSVTSVTPLPGTIGVPVSQAVVLTFSDPVVSFSNAVVRREGGALVSVGRTLSGDGLSLTLTPFGAWPDSQLLTVEVDTRLQDVFGRNPLETFTSTFRTVDLSPPAVVSVTPAAGSIQVDTGTAIAVTFNEDVSATPDLAGLIVVSGPAGPVAGTTLLADPFTAVLTPASPLAANAIYTVTVSGAVDASGNVQTAAVTATFATPDSIPPVLAFSAPAEGAWVKTATPQIAGSVSDPLSGVLRASGLVTVDGATVLAGFGGQFGNPTVASFQITAPPLSEGPHTVQATVTDNALNEASASLSFSVDTIAPGPGLVTGIVDGQVVQGTIVVGATAFEDGSGVASVDFYRNGAFFRRVSAAPFETAVDTASWSEGRHTVQALARDVAGNVGQVGAAVEILVDNDPLLVSITEPDPGDRVRDSVLVQVSPSEPVERVEISGGSQTLTDAEAPYEVFLDLFDQPEGDVLITVQGFGLQGETASAMVLIVVDRTPPAAPDGALITAEQIGDITQVLGEAGAVEPGSTVEVTNTIGGAVSTGLATATGAFGVNIDALEGDLLSVVAIDEAENRSDPTTVTVERLLAEGAIPEAGLRLWASADENVTADVDGRVATWGDRSDAVNDLSQAAVDQQPLFVSDGFNGLPVLRFDGADDWLGFRLNVQARTVFWVIREAEEATGDRAMLGYTAADYFLGDADSMWGPFTHAAVTGGETRIDGLPVDGTVTPRPKQMSVVSVITAGTLSVNQFSRSRFDASKSWHGDLAELIVYDRPLTGEERQSVEDYLVSKYQLYATAPQAATPRVSPNGGEFSGSQIVTITTPTAGAEIYYTLDGSDPATSPSATVYGGPITLTQTSTLRARAFRPGLEPSLDTAVRFTNTDGEPTPAGVTGLRLWVHAGAGLPPSLAVDRWADQSGNGNDLFVASGSQQPLLIRDELNGFPVLRFDGVDDYLGFTLNVQARTVFWVTREAAEATGDRAMLGYTAADYFLGDADSMWGPFTHAAVTGGETRIDGLPVDGTMTPRPKQMSVVSVITTGALAVNQFSRSRLDASKSWHGDLAELIVYDRPLTGGERQSVEDYLVSKYRLYAAAPRAATPRVSPNGGEFSGTQLVAITTPTAGAEIRYTLDGSDPATSPSAAVYGGPITLTQTSTVRARAFRAGLEPSLDTTVRFTNTDGEPTPAGVTGLRLWVHAGAGLPPSLAVDRWADQSGNGNDLFVASGAQQPLLIRDELNGFPVLRFDGVDDYLGFTLNTQARTVFWVIREAAEATGERAMLGYTAADYFLGDADSMWGSFTHAFVAGGETRIDGLPVDGTATPRPKQMSVVSVITTGGLTVNQFSRSRFDASKSWHGDLAELIVYDRPLTGEERQTVEDYLVSKYQPYPAAPRAATPRVSPNGGEFSGSQVVTITTPTAGAEIRYTLDGSDPATSSTWALYDGGIALTQTATLRARAFRTGLEPSLETAVRFTNTDGEPTPSGVGGLRLWVHGGAGLPPSLAVDRWADQSGNGNDLFMPSGAQQPLLIRDELSGLPVVRFDGAEDYLGFTLNAQARTVFWVIREAAEASGARAMLGYTAADYFLGDADSMWGPSTHSFVTGGETRVNGLPVDGTATPRPKQMSVVSVIATGALTVNQFSRSRFDASTSWHGDLAELIVYDRALSSAERAEVEAYLNSRYCLWLPLPASCPVSP